MSSRTLALLAALAIATPASGCMTYLVHSDDVRNDTDVSALSIGVMGLLGDGAVAAMGGGMHAAADEELTYKRTIPVWFAVLAAADLVVFLVSLDRMR